MARRNLRNRVGAFSISSPDGEVTSETAGSAISKAITVATALQRRIAAEGTTGSVYVRDQLDRLIGRIDVSPGEILVWTWKRPR